MVMRRFSGVGGGPRHAPAGPCSAAPTGGDENAPPGGSSATASRPPLRAIQPRPAPAASSRKSLWPPPAPSSGPRAAGKAPARRSASLGPARSLRKPASRLGIATTGAASSEEVPPFKVREAISFWEENRRSVQDSLSMLEQEKSSAFAKIDSCSDEGSVRNTEDILSLQLELDMFKTILVEEAKARAEAENRAAALGDELKEARFHILEACRQKEAIEKDLNEARSAVRISFSELSDKIKELNEKDEVCRDAESATSEVISSLQAQLSSVELQLDSSKKNELLAKQNLDEILRIEFLLDKSIEELIQKEVLENNYVSLLRGMEKKIRQLDHSNRWYEVKLKELEIKMQELDHEASTSLASWNKEREMLERSNEDLGTDVCELEKKVNIMKEEAEHQRMQRGKIEAELQNVRQQLQAVTSSGEAGSFLEDEIVDLPDTTRYQSDSEQSLSAYDSEQVRPPAMESMIEVLEVNELPPVTSVRPNVPVNYMMAPSDELKRLRSRNHYEGPRTATDMRFWSIEQQDLYSSIYSRAKLFAMRWIDWKHIDKMDQFACVREQCARLGLENIMSYRCDWNSELIKQFYSTVHISDDKSSMTWMADGRRITTNKRAWEKMFGVPGGFQTEIHLQFLLDDDDKRILYSDAECTLGQTIGLSPLPSIANKIIRTTIYPRTGNTLHGHNWNLLHHIVEQHPFDIIALIFGEIELFISDRNRTKDLLLYAPYIMGMIKEAFEYDGRTESTHLSYKPKDSYKLKWSKRVSRPPAHPVVAPIEQCPFQPEVEAYFDAGHHRQFKATGHRLQGEGEAVKGQTVLAQAATPAPAVSSSELSSRMRTYNSSVSAQPAHMSSCPVSQPVLVTPSPFSRFPWYQGGK